MQLKQTNYYRMKRNYGFLLSFLKKQPLSVLLITIIWVLCMIPIPENPLSGVAFIDKWTHFAMYGTLTLIILLEYGLRKKRIDWKRLAVYGILAPIVMGGLVELAQAYLTNGVRSGDWLDFVANSTGVLIGCIIGIPLALLLLSRKNKGA